MQENIDTTTSGGKLIFHIFASLAEFERDIIRERTGAGLSAARARGRKGGRPKGVDEKKRKAALSLKKDPERSVKEICEIVGISRNTYYKYTASENKGAASASAGKTGQPYISKKPEVEVSKPDLEGLKDNQLGTQPKMIKVKLWLSVENNSKFVRGKSRARAEIEQDVLSRFSMEKTDKNGWEYILSIPYTTDEELDEIILEEIYAEAERIADLRNGFIEGHITSLDDPARSW